MPRNAKLYLALAATSALLGCAAVAVDLPSITDTPTAERFQGKVIWHDLLTHTPEESKRFYGELFGWEFESPGAGFGVEGRGGYTLIRHNGRLIGGLIDTNVLNGRRDIAQWIMVVSVPDVDAAAAAAEADGAAVLTPPTDLRHRGRLAVIQDSEGANFALLQTRDGDPPQQDIEMGGFLWNELWSDDIDAASRFYAGVADLEVEDASITGDGADNYRVLRHDGDPRLGVLAKPIPGVQSVWVNYLRVDDPTAIAARVGDYGGSVLIEPRDRDVGGQAAMIAGPSGAGIALQTWPLD